MRLSPDIAVVIPAEHHDPGAVLADLGLHIPDATVGVVARPVSRTDMRRPVGPAVRWLTAASPGYHGLSAALVSGYRWAVAQDTEWTLRIDADGEYPLQPLLVHSAKELRVAHAVHFRRTAAQVGWLDMASQRLLAAIESKYLFGAPCLQHSPGAWLIPTADLRIVLPIAERVAARHGYHWGFDLLIAALLRRVTATPLRFHVVDHSTWRSRRSLGKIAVQWKTAWSIVVRSRARSWLSAPASRAS